MGLVHGVCIIVAELLDDLLDFLLVSLENSVTDNLLEPSVDRQQSVWVLSSAER